LNIGIIWKGFVLEYLQFLLFLEYLERKSHNQFCFILMFVSFFSPLSAQQNRTLQQIVDLFLIENKKVNLSSLRDEKSVWEKHILDSLAGTEFLPKMSKKVLDFGTGGGFPALPLSVVFPRAKIFAMDSVAKKLRAVESIASGAGVHNLKTIWGRGEELARKAEFRESFDVVVSRAAAQFPVLLEIVSPFIVIGGLLISYRGPESNADDILLAEKLNLEFVHKKEYTLSEGEKRTIWVFQKTAHSSSRFPRETGIPKKHPLSLLDF
jgi:16S rRNA (guanine527-N7)-methyltransferase